jgi:hypothetical protein
LRRRGMEAGLSDRASKVLRAVLHEKAGMDLAETPDPALVADQLSLRELACVRNCGPITLAEIRDWVRSLGYELGVSLKDKRDACRLLPPSNRPECACPLGAQHLAT